MSAADRVRVGYTGNENVETASSPLTYAFSKDQAASTTLPDKPSISNIQIRSAVAGLPPALKKESNPVDSTASTARVTKLSFDMDRVSPPIANLFRRVITTEVPTIAFDRVRIDENDSVVVDELLSHRLGLVPVAGPVSKMEYITAPQQVSFQSLDPTKVLVFDLDVVGDDNATCTPVYSRSLQWVPLPGQEEWGEHEEDKVFLVHPDIILTKLGPKQRLKLRAIAVKGLGSVHTKWSPVSSCYYEMKTEIDIDPKLSGATAEQLVSLCPRKVFELEDGVATVVSPERCTICRECLRKDMYPDIADSVKISKLKTSVRFHLESTGQIHAAEVFRTALALFAKRCRELTQQLQNTEVTTSTKSTSSP
eukprot:gene4081-2929_t